ncbi:MAG TPA: ATP-binding cassette domain-containing protein [Spirochaetia bacterium]|nr:ATP-binding cassette domain-containing protein [Spirochaetia bacterium]
MSSATNHLAASLSSVCLDIQGTRILSDISWTLSRGEKWVLLGLNGSGKTSLLRLLSGYGYPSRGEMEVLGEHFGRADLRRLRRRIGWVHGDLASDFPGFMNCREVVTSGKEGSIALYEDLPAEAVERADRALRAIGAGRLGERLFRTLSTGERQRVLIARALAADPELLILDEPCLGLDPVSREAFLESLGDLFAGHPGLTVIGVTHHVEEIIPGYARMLMLAGGKVVDQGTIAEVMGGEGLARIYGEACRVEKDGERYHLRFARS